MVILITVMAILTTDMVTLIMATADTMEIMPTATAEETVAAIMEAEPIPLQTVTEPTGIIQTLLEV